MVQQGRWQPQRQLLLAEGQPLLALVWKLTVAMLAWKLPEDDWPAQCMWVSSQTWWRHSKWWFGQGLVLLPRLVPLLGTVGSLESLESLQLLSGAGHTRGSFSEGPPSWDCFEPALAEATAPTFDDALEAAPLHSQLGASSGKPGLVTCASKRP